MENKDKILQLIERLRQEMHYLADLKGISDPQVLAVSKKLDEALNKYEKLVQKDKQ